MKIKNIIVKMKNINNSLKKNFKNHSKIFFIIYNKNLKNKEYK